MSDLNHRTYIIEWKKVDTFGNVEAESIMCAPLARLAWTASSTHTPNAKEKSERFSFWLRICVDAPKGTVSSRWDWVTINPDVAENYKNNNEWTNWYNWNDVSDLKEVLLSKVSDLRDIDKDDLSYLRCEK